MDLVSKTIEAYNKHNTIIVGVDFDDTIFPFNKEAEERCREVRELLLKLKEQYHVTLCLFSVADKQSLVYKSYIMEQWGLKPQYINESPVKKWGDCTKPYFNIYIDDKSGINEMIGILRILTSKTKKL